MTDITKPTASCPVDQIVSATFLNNTKAIVTWNKTLCSDNSNEDISSECTSRSGDEFDLGNTTVTCNCIDDSGNMGQCSFRIMVEGRYNTNLQYG